MCGMEPVVEHFLSPLLLASEVLVYIGHLQAILKRPVEAVDVFNQILATPNISQRLTSLVYRKLGVCVCVGRTVLSGVPW